MVGRMTDSELFKELKDLPPEQFYNFISGLVTFYETSQPNLEPHRNFIARQYVDYMYRRYRNDRLTTRQFCYQANRLCTVLFDRMIRLYLDEKEEGKL